MSECTVIISIYTPRWLTRGTVFTLGVIRFLDYRQRLGWSTCVFLSLQRRIMGFLIILVLGSLLICPYIISLVPSFTKVHFFLLQLFPQSVLISILHFCKFGLCGCGEGLSWFLRAFGDFLSEAHCITFPPWGFSGLCLRGVSLYAKCVI